MEITDLVEENAKLKQLLEGARNELAANREQSKLQIRKDMLITNVELIKAIRSNQSKADLEAIAKLSLQAGGAQFYGNIGEIVEFNFTQHESPKPLNTGTPVRIVEQGILYPGNVDFILLKAQVEAA